MHRLAAVVFVLGIGSASTALAGGYDIPILQTARQIGMGGTNVAYVDDSSAIYHNPAGLGHVDGGDLLINVSLLSGNLLGTPYQLFEAPAGNVRSEQTNAPLPFLAGSGRVHKNFVIGMGVYPVASAGGEYKYVFEGVNVTDDTRLVFFEASPAIGINLDSIGLNLGIGYRVTFVSLNRNRNTPPSILGASNVNLDMKGFDFRGFRVGAQYKPVEYFELGISYRHKTETEIKGSNNAALGATGLDTNTVFTFPSRISGGFRFDWAAFSFAFDFEWGFNSQNTSQNIVTNPGLGQPFPTGIPNVFNWSDQFTLRYGLEYRFSKQRQWPVRLGFVYDSKTANQAYPTAFGTPPTATSAVTVGFGYDHGPWEINAAFARRYGATTVSDSDLAPGLILQCPACGGAGNYEFTLNGFYLDFSYSWNKRDKAGRKKT